MKVAIIDYLMGNVASVQKALHHLKVTNCITNDFNEIRQADAIILPGVGSFEQGMVNLDKLGLIEVLTEEVINCKKPFLGACLGMQLVATTGNEPVKSPGLGWIKGEVIRIKNNGRRIPHLGWNNPTIIKDTYYKGLSNPDFYFIHSYHFQPEDANVISSTVEYGETLVSSIERENIFATQFHPEKSQHAGLTVLKNFLNLNA